MKKRSATARPERSFTIRLLLEALVVDSVPAYRGECQQEPLPAQVGLVPL